MAGKKIDAPDFGNLYLVSANEFSNKYFFNFQNFSEPNTLYFGDAATGEISKVKSLPSWFPTENYKVQQFEAVSKDGTRIPYFVVHQKSIKLDGNNPTLLYAYGGFEVPQLPRYSALTGVSWLEKDGVYVLANLRVGGEFGPKWHQSGLKENRQNDMGYKIYYFENTEGGHAGASTNEQRAQMYAQIYSYLQMKLMD